VGSVGGGEGVPLLIRHYEASIVYRKKKTHSVKTAQGNCGERKTGEREGV